jgi:hypothetical protein
MNHLTSITPIVPRASCPTRGIAVELPLATVEELDHLATLAHVSRQEILRQIITAGLISDTPHLPTGPDPIGRLAEHAYLTHVRSQELAADRSQP